MDETCEDKIGVVGLLLDERRNEIIRWSKRVLFDDVSSCNWIDEQWFVGMVVDFCRAMSVRCDDDDDGCVITTAVVDESSVDCDRDWDDDKDAVVIAVAPAVAVAADERTNFWLFDLVAFCWTSGVASFIFVINEKF